MALRQLNRERVLCLEESSWWGRLSDPTTVLPTLELLHRAGTVEEFVHRHAFGSAEFEEYMKWRKKDRRVRTYGTIFLAFHGSAKGLAVGEDTVLSFSNLEELFGDVPGAVIHLATCSMLKNGEQGAKAFLRSTGAKAVTGYDRSVDWLDAAVLDVAWVGHLARYKEVGTALRLFKTRYASLIDHLGWAAVTA